ncbi:hypothetical protein LEP1GSC059_0365 [Leptospira noguchii serovar Panama str. CZ214]|uniref:Uncharacterized protein n=1 Tax=Leptospira noguchii serovar Panama str. CZ214 TaxID=1001595 RepID=T0H205_9LEPT|nr:hypothetical protein LEP1GSC059_0365 [Leptospira noguchii serovar Panama str. CZ214]
MSLNSKKGFVKSSGATTFSFPYIQNAESRKVTVVIYIIELQYLIHIS